MSLENHFKQPIENSSLKEGENTGPKLSFIEKTNQISGEISSEYNEIPPDRTYNLCVVLKLAFMAAMGGFLFGYANKNYKIFVFFLCFFYLKFALL